MSLIWTDIYDNFKTLMEDSTTGVGSLTSVTNTFVESDDTVDLAALPSSIFNGKYSINLNSINEITQDFTTYLDYTYSVILKIAFEYNLHADKRDYNNSIQDIEEIIRLRLSNSSWTDTSIILITLNNVSNIEFQEEAIERFAIVNIEFLVQGRVTL